MKRKNTTRNVLFTSIMSLLLCVSMLVGTTFAWFTDEVVTGMNTIAAGNLDVELLADGVKVTNTTPLFDDVTLWEPGVVVYENLQVANVGTLALKYQMTLNFGSENDLNGRKLSEVLQVALLDKADVTNWNDRVEVLEKAQKATNVGTLQNFYAVGSLEAGANANEQAIVIFWAPGDNDNDYNANNGKVTSDGEPLHIEFGINLQATQKMSEEDSFGPDYDAFATILPKAKVINTGAKTVKIMAGIDADELALNTSFQFQPNETAAEAATSAYKYWHADYVVTADKDVPADSIALAGYYKAWCGDNGWVAMVNEGTDIAAGTEVRLVEQLNTTVNYEEICELGNDGIGFLCGVSDLTGANAGTTITVELRMYETTIDPINPSGTANDETGEYEVIGTYSYTFPAVQVATVDELKAALKAGTTLIDAKGAEVGMLNYGLTKALVPAGKTVTIKNAKFGPGASYGNQVDGTVIFENCTFDADVYSIHTDGGSGKLVFNNCTLTGWCSFGSVEVEMNNCNIRGNGKYALVRCYKDAVFNNCTFDLSDADRTDSFADRVDCGSANPSNTIILNGCTNVNGAMTDIVPASVVALGKIIIK